MFLLRGDLCAHEALFSKAVTMGSSMPKDHRHHRPSAGHFPPKPELSVRRDPSFLSCSCLPECGLWAALTGSRYFPTGLSHTVQNVQAVLSQLMNSAAPLSAR